MLPNPAAVVSPIARRSLARVAWMVVCLLAVPGLSRAQFKGAWLPPEHTLTAKLGITYSHTDAWFCGNNQGHCDPGERDRLNPLVERQATRLVTSDLTLDVSPVRNVAVSVYVPYHDIRFDRGFGDPLKTNGLGDVSLTVRTGLVSGRWAVSGGYSIELPVGDFTTNLETIPVGRGTRNHVVFAEAGVSLWPRPAYVQMGILYRLRDVYTNREVSIDWGDEVQGQIEGGWRVSGGWWLKLMTRGMKSAARRDIGFPPPPQPEFRSIWEVVPGGFYRWSSGWIEAWVSIPLAGRNMPSDPFAGISFTGRVAVHPGRGEVTGHSDRRIR